MSLEVWLYIGGMLLQHSLSFITSVIIARWLGPHDYGVFGVIRNIFSMALIVAPLGFDLSLLRHVAEQGTNFVRILAQIRLIRTVTFFLNISLLALVITWIGPVLGRSYYQYPDFPKLLSLAFIALPFAADAAILSATFRGLRRPFFQVVASLYIQPAVRTLAQLGALILGYGLVGVTATTLCGYLAASTAMSLSLRAFRNSNHVCQAKVEGDDFQQVRRILTYSIWFAAMLLAYGALKNIDVIFLARVRPPNEVGEYVALSSVAQIIQVYPLALSQTLGPTISGLFVANRFSDIQRELNLYLRRASLLASPIFAGVAVFGPWLSLLFGEQFRFQPSLCVTLAFAFYISAVLGPLGYPLSMTGRHKTEFAVLVAGLAAAAVGCHLLASRFGGNGVALAISLGYLGINLARAALTSNLLKFVPGSLLDLLPPLCCIALAAGTKALLEATTSVTLASALAGSVVYLALVFLLYTVAIFNSSERAAASLRLRKAFGFFKRNG